MINVLMVVDGESTHAASFGVVSPSDVWFTLRHFIDTITSGYPGSTQVAVTKAQRGTDPGDYSTLSSLDRSRYEPDLPPNFRFTDIDLTQFDVILLFGFAAEFDIAGQLGRDRLSDDELAALASFMDGGGGVFATGDHENLGRPLCGLVPRVRSMRKWYFDDPYETVPRMYGEPYAPAGVDSFRDGEERLRLDTLVPNFGDPDPMGGNWFDNQSDDIPQVLELRNPIVIGADGTPRDVCWEDPIIGPWGGSWGGAHPLLHGRVGPIRSFPDHMHEGEVIEPWETNRILTFAGLAFVEYPNPPIGPRPLPRIVAWGYSGGYRTDVQFAESTIHAGDTMASDSRMFGAVGAYDGRPAGIGRVAVDSTFHHFVDINLIGDPGAVGTKKLGFLTADGMPILNGMDDYFRNIILWLARPAAQAHMWWAIVSETARKASVAEVSPVGAQTRLDGLGSVVLSSLRGHFSEATLWNLMSATLAPGYVSALREHNPSPCSQPSATTATRRRIANLIAGATAADQLTRGRDGERLERPEARQRVADAHARAMFLYATDLRRQAAQFAEQADAIAPVR